MKIAVKARLMPYTNEPAWPFEKVCFFISPHFHFPESSG
jgi:hypothetical protein